MKTEEVISIVPDPHYLKHMLMANALPFPAAISELVDNAFDQGATKVTIRVDSNCIAVVDDGNGCADIQKMIMLGGHKRTPTTRLGRYGAGLKHAATSLGDLASIQTVHDGVMRKADVDWNEIYSSGKWEQKVSADDTTTSGKGTSICISQLRPARRRKDELIRPLSFNFSPAIQSRRVIELRWYGEDVQIEPWTLPAMESLITASNSLSDDDGAEFGYRVRAGLVECNSRRPFIFAYEHRIVAENSEPCNGRPPSTGFMAYVELVGRWPLLVHKDGLDDCPAVRWLYASLEEDCSDLMDRAAVLGEQIKLQEIEAILAGVTGLKQGRALRGPRENHGKVEPRGTPRKVEEAARVHTDFERNVVERSGSKRPGESRGVTVSYGDFDDGRVGDVMDQRRCISIVLNKRHEHIQTLMDGPNRPGIISVCLALLSANKSLAKSDAQMEMGPVNWQDFLTQYSKWLKELASNPATP
jgi:hypothetical protein